MSVASYVYPRVLSIAGSDSGGGAGIQADLKTFAALGVYGMTAMTAITAQNTQGVTAIHGVPVAVFAAQVNAVATDIGADAVKIGMLHSAELVDAVAQALARYRFAHVVLDTVMVATSGAILIEQPAIRSMVQQLFPLASIITPNLDEAALLVQQPLRTVEDMRAAALRLQHMGASAVLVKGGHLEDPHTVVDVLRMPDGSEHVMTDARIATGNTHGTGCTLSSAIAAYLALGLDLAAAVESARCYIRGALQAGAAVRTGQGHGPLNHAFAPQPMRLIPVANQRSPESI